ncbi:hypothetical protein BH11ACT8_BH11ACT8_07630 [soil metagenome]
MFSSFNGLPLHPLVVHGVVVLLPLAIVGTLAIVFRPAWRTTYGYLVVGAALGATVLIPVATSSGESLEKQVGDPGEHAELGDQLLWFALVLLLASAALVLLQRRSERSTAPVSEADPSATDPGQSSALRNPLTAVAVIAVVAALACGVQVYRVGDSGARAAWGDASSTTAP